jgi:hypothetical protein
MPSPKTVSWVASSQVMALGGGPPLPIITGPCIKSAARSVMPATIVKALRSDGATFWPAPFVNAVKMPQNRCQKTPARAPLTHLIHDLIEIIR